jgi:hypothetical protein
MTTEKKSDPFLDIAPAAEMVAGVPVPGLTFESLAALMNRFALLAGLFAGGTVDAAQMLAAGPEAAAAFMAAGIGRLGDAAVEGKFRTLPVGTQVAFLDATIRASFPDGLQSFRDRLVRLAAVLAVDTGEAAQGGTAATEADQASPHPSSS